MVVGLLCALWSAAIVHAAGLDERAFWSLLQQTDSLLQQAIGQSGGQREATLAKIRQSWANVDAVRLADGTTISVDMQWIIPVNSETDVLQYTQTRVRALLEYHARQPGTDLKSALAALDRVLKDPRFQYPDYTPTPLPPTPTPLPPGERPAPRPNLSILSNLSQFVLFALGVIAVIAMIVYLARSLRVQRLALRLPTNGDSDDPTTSTAALESAATSEETQDYRNAIRYLYLSSLLLLDERGLIRYDRTLTNREHLRQIQHKPQLAEALRPVVETFDRVWYGFAPVDDALYQTFRANVEQLHRIAPDQP
ncbi:MAG: DUF4129 domain-containing protein [Anaerolineae bacterium]|nr:DUF4129 domain-containing protein [Anaerolineae bacterium]